jgi:tetratricopeptide (TPR) repeat protein|tara:strand:+ start:33 stop:1397 length:1365 start_codon:yes stop_codon:yes gene_type:complete
MDLNFGKRLIAQHDFKDAETIFLQLLKKKEKSYEINYFLGKIYFELRKIEKSYFHYEECLKLQPNSIIILLNLANLQQSSGNLEKAKEIYLKILNLNKNIIRAYYGLYTLNTNYLEDNYYENIIEINKKLNINILEKCLSNFLLSKIEKRKKNYDLEIKYLEKAHQDCFKLGNVRNLQSQYYYKNIISKYYNKIKFTNSYKKKNYFNKVSPIFIIGLPRSGSTLTETILTSGQTKVNSFGESLFINMAVAGQLPKQIFSKNFYMENQLKIKSNEFEEFIYKKYKQYLSFNDKNLIFLDKSLENFLNIDFILEIFPNAKFLHCKRNLKDSVIAIYLSLLPELSWTHKIEDILSYINNYIKIINFFKKKYPKKILDISLEKFTKKKEKISKKIFEFCNLKWDPKILEFYNRKDLDIRTTSNIQLRKKITQYDNYKYKKYYTLVEDFREKFSWLKDE